MSAISGIRAQDYSSYSNYGNQQSKQKPSIDSDGDNAISKDELSSFLSEVSSKTSEDLDSEEIFTSLDSDGNGSISEDEGKKLSDYLPNKGMPPGEPPQGGMFSKIDSNGDNSIDKSELSSLVEDISSKSGEEIDSEELFASLDSDEDGTISEEESEALKDYLPKPPEKEEENSMNSEMVAMMQQNIANSYSAGKTDISKMLGSIFSSAS